MSNNSLQLFERGAVLLAEANTIQKAKELKDLSITASDWAKRKGMGEEAIQYCRGYALESERRMGELLLETERAVNKPGPGRGKAGYVALPAFADSPPTLADLGLTKRDSAEAQLLAQVPRETFEQVKNGKKTKAQLRREKKKQEHEIKVRMAAEESKTETIKGPFGLILADPPWKYEHCEANNREIENQYETASLKQIFTHIEEVKVAKDCILFLWATAPKLEEAISVMNSWGFNYRSCAVWDKEMIGMGYWWRIQHELLLVGVKGNPQCTPESERISSVFRSPRGKHSVKPEIVYSWIERAFPDTQKIEMYCRIPRKGWGFWGNEV